MKIKILALIFIITVPFFISDSFASGDSKYYSEYVLKHKLNDKFDLFFNPEFRAKNDMGNTYYYQFRLGSTFHANKNLDLSLASRYIQTKDTKSDWSNSDMQYIEMIAMPKTKLAGFNVSDANKFEYRFLENARDRWVYRNLVSAGYPLKIKTCEFTPYVSNEVYYDFEINKVNLDWITIGANKKITKDLTIGLYARSEISRVGTSSKWTTNRVLGSNVTIDF